MLKEPGTPERCGPANASEFYAISRAVRSSLPKGRYRHVLGVARMAERLARRYGSSTSKARIGAMLHDIARAWPSEEMLEYAKRNGLSISPAEEHVPVLLHARIGAHIARRQFGIDDPDTLAAIERHTVAVPGMTDLQKILYIADSIEPSRTYPGRAALEAAAFRSLDEGMIACIESSTEYLGRNGVSPAPQTQALYRRLVEQREARA